MHSSTTAVTSSSVIYTANNCGWSEINDDIFSCPLIWHPFVTLTSSLQASLCARRWTLPALYHVCILNRTFILHWTLDTPSTPSLAASNAPNSRLSRDDRRQTCWSGNCSKPSTSRQAEGRTLPGPHLRSIHAQPEVFTANNSVSPQRIVSVQTTLLNLLEDPTSSIVDDWSRSNI